jgi:O-antigen ligase
LRPEFYFLFWLFPIQDTSLISSVTTDVIERVPEIERFYGPAVAGMGICFYLIAKHGIQGVLNYRKYWRLAAFGFAVVISLFGGFRSFFILFSITFALVFYLEGLFRTRLFWILAFSATGMAAVILPLANKLPLPVQRTLSVLPFVEVSPIAQYDARGSSDWRLQMWRIVWPQVPQYLILGKGLQINALDLDLANELARRGLADTAEVSMLAGDYHNGPLSLLVPFGLPGTLAFVWFLIAAIRALHANYRYGPPEYHTINTFLLAFFIARLLLYLFIFGGFYSDIAHFVGIVGFSLSLNAGICEPASQLAPEPTTETTQPPKRVGGLVPVISR